MFRGSNQKDPKISNNFPYEDNPPQRQDITHAKAINDLKKENGELKAKVKNLERSARQLEVQLITTRSLIKTEKQFTEEMFLGSAKNGNLEKLSITIRLVENIFAVNNRGNTALHLATIHSHLAAAGVLIEKEPTLLFIKNLQRLNPIELCASLNNISSLAWLYAKVKNNPAFDFESAYTVAGDEAKKWLANTKLLDASKSGDFAGVQNAIVKNADINTFTQNTHETALHNAIHFQYEEIVAFLLKYNPNIQEEKIHQSIIDYIAEHQNENIKQMVANYILLNAANNGSYENMQKAFTLGADIDATNANGETVTHIVSTQANPELLKLCLSKKPDLLKQDHHQGNLALHIAALTGEKSILKLLIEAYVLEGYSIKQLNNAKNQHPCDVADNPTLAFFIAKQYGAFKEKHKPILKDLFINHSFIANINKANAKNSAQVEAERITQYYKVINRI